MNKLIVLAIVLAAALAGAGAGYWYAARRAAHDPASEASVSTPDPGRRVLYWHDPMVPGQKFDKPGKSPFMDMQLVPVYADEGADQGSVTINSRVQQNLGIRVAEVTKGALAPAVEAVGGVAYNERNTVVVQARSNGFVEKLNVRAPLDPVRKGQALAELYVPDWVAAQEEYLSVKRLSGAGLGDLVEGARQRLRLAGMDEEQIRLVDSTGKVHARVTVTAPLSGVVAELGIREGTTVMSGALLFRINGLDTVWVNAEVPESLASRVRPGNTVEARTSALPGTVFKGRISTVLPEVNPATRTLKARIELGNPGHRLVPGMFATVNFASAARQEALLVPAEAVIQTGRRSVVIVAQDGGRFAPVEVETGIEADGRTEIRKGLEAGQKVVVSGQFLIDSEASLRAATMRMGEAPVSEPARAGVEGHRGTGKIIEVDPVKGRVELDHGPIPSMKWPAMRMGFMVTDKSALARLKKGDTVEFEVRGKPAEGGDYVIDKIIPAEKAR
jgi:membrane fusion protein, copper/silver efflux system